MKRRFIPLIIFLFALLTVGGLFLQTKKPKENQVCFKSYCFNVEVARTAEEQSRGLMYREKLGQDKGMLFVFDKEAEYSFWMKNTLISLDIIWINGNKEVVFIGENIQPCQENSLCPSVNPGKGAKYVLELNAGVSKKISLKIGDKLSFSIK